MLDAIELHDNYATPLNRAAVHAGTVDYLPIGLWKTDTVPDGFTSHPDVFLVPVSPPDRHGYCSFGPGVWLSVTLARNAKYVIAEVHEDFIRTGGENHIHLDQLDLVVEADAPTGAAAAPALSDEEVAAVEVICTLVAAELVNDGDTVQMGVGTVSASLGLYLDDKNDLGVQTELITGGIVDLVDRGVVTGNRKTIHKRKVVGSALVALSADEMARIDGHPVFELYDFGHTDDLRRLIQIENFVTVNNALQVDLTGQVSAESIGQQMYTGVGGPDRVHDRRRLLPRRQVGQRHAVELGAQRHRAADLPHRADARPRRRRHRAPHLRRLRRHRERHRHPARQDHQGTRPRPARRHPPRLPRRAGERSETPVRRLSRHAVRATATTEPTLGEPVRGRSRCPPRPRCIWSRWALPGAPRTNGACGYRPRRSYYGRVGSQTVAVPRAERSPCWLRASCSISTKA